MQCCLKILLIAIIFIPSVDAFVMSTEELKRFYEFDVIQNDTQIHTNFTQINDTVLEAVIYARTSLPGGYRWSMALCNISHVPEVYYQNEDNQGGFNFSTWIEAQFGLLTDYGMPADWCLETNNTGFVLFSSGSRRQLPKTFRLLLPDDGVTFNIYAGDGSVIIGIANHLFATNTGANEQGVHSSNGTLHAVWRAAGNDIWYARSEPLSNGADWTSRELFGAGSPKYATVGLVILENDTLVLYAERTDITPNVMVNYYSDDNGVTWTFEPAIIDLGLSIDSSARFSCVPDKNSIVHCCGIQQAASGNQLIYSNDRTNVNTYYNTNPSHVSTGCDIAVDSQSTIFIVEYSFTNKTWSIWSNVTGIGEDNRTQYYNTTQPNIAGANVNPVITVSNNDDILWAHADSSVGGAGNSLIHCQSTSGIFPNKTCSLMPGTVDPPTQYFAPDISISAGGLMTIVASSDGGVTSTGNILIWNSTDLGQNWDTANPLNLNGGWPGIIDTRYPVTNRQNDTLRLIWTNNTKLVLFEGQVSQFNRCQPSPPGNYVLELAWRCIITSPIDLRPYNLTLLSTPNFSPHNEPFLISYAPIYAHSINIQIGMWPVMFRGADLQIS